MASVFSRIIAGELPAYRVAENDRFLAFLDVFPLREGHTLVIPKIETDNIFDLEPSLYAGLFAFTQEVGKAIGKVIPCRKVGMAVVGLEVPHAHIHLVPVDEVGDLNFARPKLQFTAEEMEAIRLKIVSVL